MLRNPILTSPSLYEQGAHVPSGRLFAAGIERTGQPWLVEQPQQSAADLAAHAAASHVRHPAMTA